MPCLASEHGTVDPPWSGLRRLKSEKTSVAQQRVERTDQFHIGIEINPSLFAQCPKPRPIGNVIPASIFERLRNDGDVQRGIPLIPKYKFPVWVKFFPAGAAFEV